MAPTGNVIILQEAISKTMEGFVFEELEGEDGLEEDGIEVEVVLGRGPVAWVDGGVLSV